MIHEDLRRRDEVVVSSDRSFGLVFAAVFVLIAAWQGWAGSHPLPFALGGAIFLGFAVWRPRTLAPLNRLWFRFGMVLSRLIHPVVMTAMYCVVIVPAGVLMRLSGRDQLRLKRDPGAQSYWIARDPPGPPGDSFRNQF